MHKSTVLSRKKQWFWFIGLYVLSVLAVGVFAALVKLLIH